MVLMTVGIGILSISITQPAATAIFLLTMGVGSWNPFTSFSLANAQDYGKKGKV